LSARRKFVPKIQRERGLSRTRGSLISSAHYDTLSKEDASWARRTFGGSHAKMEADDDVWRHVEDLIVTAITSRPATSR
jgi:hypothetical protein